MTQAIAGGIYVAVFFTLLMRNLSNELLVIGYTILGFVFNFVLVCFTYITGSILGEKATYQTIGQCCWFLSISAFVGFLFALILKYTDRLNDDMTNKTPENHDSEINNKKKAPDGYNIEISYDQKDKVKEQSNV